MAKRVVPCARNRDEMKKLDRAKVDCFILDFDPDHNSLSNISVSSKNDDDDLLVLAHKGKVACRDFPHPRHSCAIFPFRTTRRDKHCKRCYCYVCDVPAPCELWVGKYNHCLAFDNEKWNATRKSAREANKLRKQEEECSPHWRHKCLKFPFTTTHQTSRCCEQCYCYVCEVPAPCEKWVGSGMDSHRHANGNEWWRYQRKLKRQGREFQNEGDASSVEGMIM